MSRIHQARHIIDHIRRPGWFHMAADDLLAETLAQASWDAALRIYTWNPPAVSLGRNQPPQDVDSDLCRRRGWEIVRRPTGGRALLHHGDVSYSIAWQYPAGSVSSLKFLYTAIAGAVIGTLRGYGVAANLCESPSRLRPAPKRRLCIESHARGEVVVHGRKIAVAAQRIVADCILQQGSIFVGGDPQAISDVAANHRRPRRHTDDKSGVSDALKRHAITITEAAAASVDVAQFKRRLISALAEKLNIELAPDDWSSAELKEIHKRRQLFSIDDPIAQLSPLSVAV